jgi:hypothetical protein
MTMRRASGRTAMAGAACAAVLLLADIAATAADDRFDGVNVIAVPEHRFGSDSAMRSLAAAKRLGATTVAIVPFLWQANPTDPAIGRGHDMPDDELRTAIRVARSLGLTVMVKPHVWVPESWAGAIALTSEADWRAWFAGYRAALMSIVAIAAEENAQALAIGTELAKTTHRAEWFELIRSVRAAFPGTLLYVAHNADEAEMVPFWPLLDAVGVSLYPRLGADGDRSGRIAAMDAVAERLDRIAARTGKPIVVSEIGLRSAHGAAAKPWESAEERSATADPWLQAEVLADWLDVLKRPSVRGVMVWRWFTDPAAGGLADTDFTVQGKPAEGVLMCAWTAGCGR